MVLDWISRIKIEVHIFFYTDFDVHLIILRSGTKQSHFKV